MDASAGCPASDRIDKAGVVSLRRAVNDEIARVAASFLVEDTEWFEFLCECGDFRCRGKVKLMLADYAKLSAGEVVGHD